MHNKKDLRILQYYDKFHERLENEHAQIYEPTFRLRKKFQADIIAMFQGKGKIALDIGCGTGHTTIALLNNGFKVDAVDPSRKAIKLLKQKFRNNQNIRFYVSSLQKFKPRKKYDLIICYEVLEHIENDYKALHHLVSFLKDNGFIIIDVPMHPHLYSKADEMCGHYRRYTITRINDLIEKNNLQEFKRYYFGFPVTYLSKLIRKLFQKRNIKLVEKLSKNPSKKMNFILRLYDKLLFLDKNWFGVPLSDDIIIIAKKKV